MTRGNQREKRRAEVQKTAGAAKKNSQSGTEMAKAKESAAEIMRKKQAAADAKREEEAKKS